MQQRRLRLGDILDDYCPRERRITNHVIVAMIDDDVKQTRCTTCDADHEYKQARVPAPRRKKEAVLTESPSADAVVEPVLMDDTQPLFSEEEPVQPEQSALPAEPDAVSVEDEEDAQPATDDEGPVHRRLIRATLPRPEGQSPERKVPEFTIRQPGGRGRNLDGSRSGSGHQRQGRGRRPARNPQQGQGGGQQSRFGGPRQDNTRHGSGQGDRQNGNRPVPSGGQRGGGRPGQGQQRGPRPPGRKRGR